MTDSELPAAPALGDLLEAGIYAANLDEAEHFYGTLLGLERVLRAGDRHVFFRIGNTILLVFNPHETVKPATNAALPVPPHGATGPGHICFAATGDEIEAWKSRLETAGIEIEEDFHWPNGARSIYFRDPAGNSIEMAEPRLWL